jgi:hypothetical protein
MNKILDRLKKKQTIFYIVCFTLLFLSFYTNVFKIIPDYRYQEYETFVEALVVGKMAKADKDGVFAASGFTGVNYDKALVADSVLQGDQIGDLLIRDHIITQFKLQQLDYYTGKEKTPDDYCVYVSHSGGNAIFWYGIQSILPFSNDVNYQILRFINCLLLSLCFMLFIGWIYRNFGFSAAIATFILTFFTSLLVLFGGNGLWWTLWNFYAPFLTMLLLLEKRHTAPAKVPVKKILIFLFLAVVVKLFFSGLEFISTAMLAIFVPIVYYAIVEKWKVFDFIKLSVLSGLVAGVAIVMQFGALIVQLRYLLGSYNQATEYLYNAFLRRSSFKSGLSGADADSGRFADSDSLSFLWNNVIKDYLRGNAFEWGFVHMPFNIFYAVIFGIIIAFCIFIFFLGKQIKYKAFVITTFVSVVCPLSWYIIFKEHSFWHPQIDFIVWYMPFLLFGYASIGMALSLIFSKREQIRD